MDAVLGPLARPSRSARSRSELKVPIRPTKVPIRPTKSAHPTYKKCPSDLQN